jgi:hypothetical protein
MRLLRIQIRIRNTAKNKTGTLLRTKRGSIMTISKEIRRIQYEIEQTCGSERVLGAKTNFITQNSDRKIATVF